MDRTAEKVSKRTGKPTGGKPTLPIDSKMKKSIFGKGKVEKKEIMEWAGTKDEDRADAEMFCAYLHKVLQNE
jgi:hypothetical protein